MERVDYWAGFFLSAIQQAVPLEPRPWAALGQRLGATESAVLAELERLRGPGGVIREISAIFDARALGYHQALVAMKVGPGRLAQAGQVVAAHPGVSHCYGRDDQWNLWLTLAVYGGAQAAGPDALSHEAGLLARRAGADDFMVLPSVKMYKLRVRFDQEGPAQNDNSGPGHGGGAADQTQRIVLPLPPTPAQVAAVAALQQDLPTQAQPFAPLAAKAGMTVEDLLACARQFIAAGWMRRYAAVLHHRRAGAQSNVMVVWRAADRAQADRAGQACLGIDAVSHCYLRTCTEAWPWNFYTMIHGRSADDCRRSIEMLASAAGLSDRRELWTTREFAKRRVKLFAAVTDIFLWRDASPCITVTYGNSA